MDAAPAIFDRRLRAQRRDRAAPDFARHDFLYRTMLDELLDRLADVRREFTDILVVGCPDASARERLAAMGARVTCVDPGEANARANGGIQAEEDALSFAEDSFDLIIACGTLDSVNDLPGALALIRRVLRPDGLFLGAFVGAGSLAWLKSATLAADSTASRGVTARIHPQIDVRSAGDLLSRAGFALQVADGERLDVGYGDPVRLMHDLRGMAATNLLAGRSRKSIGRAWLSEVFAQFTDMAGQDGRLREVFELVYLTGWAPAPDQPKPAKRGSATTSLAHALKHRD